MRLPGGRGFDAAEGGVCSGGGDAPMSGDLAAVESTSRRRVYPLDKGGGRAKRAGGFNCGWLGTDNRNPPAWPLRGQVGPLYQGGEPVGVRGVGAALPPAPSFPRRRE